MRSTGIISSATASHRLESAPNAGAGIEGHSPATSVGDWLNNWLVERFPSDFIPAGSVRAARELSRPLPGDKALAPKKASQTANTPALKEKLIANSVTLAADNDQKIARLETLLKRIGQKLGKPLLQNIRVVIDDSLGNIGQRNGTGNQAAYQNTRDANSGKIYQESLHINSQFLDYLIRQPIGKAEAYLAAILFHEQSHRDVLLAAEAQGTFHRITQADERNANERAEAAIAQHYPEYYSWLRQNYFDLFRHNFNEAYGSLPPPREEDWQLIYSGNSHYNQRYFPH
jgi:hypothetical protein